MRQHASVSIPYRKVRYKLRSREQYTRNLFQSLIGRFGTGMSPRAAEPERFQSLIGRFGTEATYKKLEELQVSIPY